MDPNNNFNTQNSSNNPNNYQNPNKISSFRQFKEKELERLDKIRETQQEANHLRKMEIYLKLSSEEHLNDRKKEMLKKLEQELFDN
ncbi:hypothetical protein QL285_032012 [Trifolium repens]|nr:hypothetical protein QL285_032012 [Trifolium repens]